MKRLLFFICTLLCANVILAQVIWQDIEFRTRPYDTMVGFDEIRGTAEVIDYHGNEANLSIPFYLTYEVGNPGFVSPFPPVTYIVTSIGDYAFMDCSSLTSVNINDGIDSIGYAAFYNCSSLTSITIGDSVTFIDDWAFGNCSSLTSIGIPFGVTSIGESTFYYCSSLTSVGIPNSVTSIGDHAFRYCSSLTSVNIPNSVISIGNSAFYDCSSLTSVTIPNSVTSIDDWVFGNCSSLTSVNIPNSITSLNFAVFDSCINLTSVNIPNSVTSIGGQAFTDCSSLTSVTIPNSVTSIGERAFAYCSSLTSVTCLATNPPALGGSAFYYIGSPSTLYVPNGCGEAYINSSWAQYFDCIVELGSGATFTNLNLNIEVNNEEWGSVEVNEGCGTATLTAVAEMDCSEFLHWSDGDTNNPRVVNVASDTSFTAIFKDPVLDTIINATIMQGETYNFNGQELSEEGVYNATVLSVAGCEINLTVNLYVIPNNYTNGETSSLQETELEEIVFYPNPTKGLISFSKTIERIEVVDISGKILLSFSNVREINIGDLPEGSYLLRLHSNENSVLRKIVKE